LPTLSQRAGAIAFAPVAAVLSLVDRPLRAWQRATGLGGMATFFLAPNMAIFGIFILFPLVVNFLYSMTGGTDLFLADRTFVGGQHYARLLDCENHLEPATCKDDLFWNAVWNTAAFVIIQVSLLTVVAMTTALILNRELRARSFWRAVFFFPVLLSPVVVGLIWRWILQREGLLNLIVVGLGGDQTNWLTDRTYAFACDEDYDAERIAALAALVDEKMRVIHGSRRNLPPMQIAVLAALNLVDELFRLESEYDTARHDIAERASRLSESLGRLLEGAGIEP